MHRRGVRVLLVAVCAVGGLVAVWRLRDAGAAPGVWVPDLAVGWAFLASGFVIGDRRDGLRQAVLVAAVGVAWFLADLVPDLTSSTAPCSATRRWRCPVAESPRLLIVWS